jgi:hypothetical protein
MDVPSRKFQHFHKFSQKLFVLQFVIRRQQLGTAQQHDSDDTATFSLTVANQKLVFTPRKSCLIKPRLKLNTISGQTTGEETAPTEQGNGNFPPSQLAHAREIEKGAGRVL